MITLKIVKLTGYLKDIHCELQITLNGFVQRTSRKKPIEALRMDVTDKLTFEVFERGCPERLGKRSLSFAKLCKGSSPHSTTHNRTIKFREGEIELLVDCQWNNEQERIAYVQGSVFEKLRELGCHDVFLTDLYSLMGWDIVMICDDSGSMAARTDMGTRWSELQTNVKMLLDICITLDPNGIDIYFLNRPGKKNVTQADTVKKLFKDAPSGGTPLTEALQKVLLAKDNQPPMLIIIATDGQPNSLPSFRAALESRPRDVFVSFLACTDNSADVAYLNRLDEEVFGVDVLDDYHSERQEVLRVQHDADYTMGDHCARMLLGPIFEKYDNLDRIKFY